MEGCDSAGGRIVDGAAAGGDVAGVAAGGAGTADLACRSVSAGFMEGATRAITIPALISTTIRAITFPLTRACTRMFLPTIAATATTMTTARREAHTSMGITHRAITTAGDTTGVD